MVRTPNLVARKQPQSQRPPGQPRERVRKRFHCEFCNHPGWDRVSLRDKHVKKAHEGTSNLPLEIPSDSDDGHESDSSEDQIEATPAPQQPPAKTPAKALLDALKIQTAVKKPTWQAFSSTSDSDADAAAAVDGMLQASSSKLKDALDRKRKQQAASAERPPKTRPGCHRSQTGLLEKATAAGKARSAWSNEAPATLSQQANKHHAPASSGIKSSRQTTHVTVPSVGAVSEKAFARVAATSAPRANASASSSTSPATPYQQMHGAKNADEIGIPKSGGFGSVTPAFRFIQVKPGGDKVKDKAVGPAVDTATPIGRTDISHKKPSPLPAENADSDRPLSPITAAGLSKQLKEIKAKLATAEDEQLRLQVEIAQLRTEKKELKTLRKQLTAAERADKVEKVIN